MKLYLLFFLFLLFSCTDKPGKLTGVATYTYDYSTRPDIGAKIYIINKEDLKNEKYSDIFHRIIGFKMQKSDYLVHKISKNELDTISYKLMENLIQFKSCQKIIHTTADGTGRFMAELMPGEYYVVSISRHLVSNNYAEVNGNVDVHSVEIKPQAETTCDFDFQ